MQVCSFHRKVNHMVKRPWSKRNLNDIRRICVAIYRRMVSLQHVRFIALTRSWDFRPGFMLWWSFDIFCVYIMRMNDKTGQFDENEKEMHVQDIFVEKKNEKTNICMNSHKSHNIICRILEKHGSITNRKSNMNKHPNS